MSRRDEPSVARRNVAPQRRPKGPDINGDHLLAVKAEWEKMRNRESSRFGRLPVGREPTGTSKSRRCISHVFADRDSVSGKQNSILLRRINSDRTVILTRVQQCVSDFGLLAPAYFLRSFCSIAPFSSSGHVTIARVAAAPYRGKVRHAQVLLTAEPVVTGTKHDDRQRSCGTDGRFQCDCLRALLCAAAPALASWPG
jgi:hypothetical protein